MNTKFSLNDAEVIKGNDEFTNDEMSKILGGTAEMGCVCKCGTNTASMQSSTQTLEKR